MWTVTVPAVCAAFPAIPITSCAPLARRTSFGPASSTGSPASIHAAARNVIVDAAITGAYPATWAPFG